MTVRKNKMFLLEHFHVSTFYSVVFFACYKSKTFCIRETFQDNVGFNVHGSVHRKNIPIYIQQDATLHSLFYLETALHVSSGTIMGPCIVRIF